jgi:hypothetical protein
MKKIVHLLFILSFFIFCFCKTATAQCWNDGDMTTYGQGQWGGNGAAATLLADKYYNIYPSGVFIIGNAVNPSLYYLIFDAATALEAYLPQTTPIGALDGTLVNPTDSHSGIFGGYVAALKLNIDFSDAGFLTGNSGLKFGDLVIFGLTNNTSLNGMTVRQLFDIVNTALSSAPTPYTIADLTDILLQVNASFGDGTPSTWAQQHLKKGWKNGDFITNTDTQWGNGGTANAILLSNYGTVYAGTGYVFKIGSSSGFTATWTDPTILSTYLPSSGSPGVLNANLVDPLSTSSGAFGGFVAALKLDIDFADAGFLNGTSGIHFGDLVLCGFATLTDLNGLTVRQLLGMANTLLSGGTATYTIADITVIAVELIDAFFNSTPSAWAQQHLKRGWQEGDLKTYSQAQWGGSGTASTILLDKYNTVYASTGGAMIVGLISGYSIQFDMGEAVHAYLPQIGSAGALTVTLFDPISSASGSFGGDVTALKLNIDFTDAGFLSGNSGLKFGDLTICGLTSNTSLNGMTVRQFLDLVNTALSGGSTPYAIADLDIITSQLAGSFAAGPSTFAQLHLVNGSCECNNTVTNQCPTATAINITTTVGAGIKFKLQGSDADNNPLTYFISQNPTHGSAVIAGSDSVIYTPNAGYYGADQFKYKVNDGNCNAEATVDITIVVCPQGSGYWKNNPSSWPVTSLLLGTISYTQSQLITIFNTAVGTGNNADASLILAKQLIAAKLSIAAGTTAINHVADSIAAADVLIGSNHIPMKVKPNTPLGKKMTSLALFLESFNNGAMTTGCSVPATKANEQLIVENEIQIPKDLVLEQNHPNPFNGSTTIRYALPGNETYHVSLKVYDMMGKEIKTIVNDAENAGWKTVSFDASNLSAGIYFYRLTANSFTETKKMVLVK